MSKPTRFSYKQQESVKMALRFFMYLYLRLKMNRGCPAAFALAAQCQFSNKPKFPTRQ